MKQFKLIFALFIALSFGSCDSTRVTVTSDNFNHSMYDYNYMHQLYNTNPYFFQYQTYYDTFGYQYYYYQHPYYIRYCRERNIKPYYPNRGRSNQNYINTRRITRDVDYRPTIRRTNTTRRTNTNYRRTNTTRRTNTNYRRPQVKRPTTRPNNNRSRGG